MKVLITGSNGFIGSNLVSKLSEESQFEVIRFTRDSTKEDLRNSISKADFIFHAAGVNRPENDIDFARVNTDLTKLICNEAIKTGRKIPILFTSSVHVERGNTYGDSKLNAENALLDYSSISSAPVFIFRLPHVVGKWCRPNYNSVVSTFCHNIARNIPIAIDDPDYLLNVVYIDDLIDTAIQIALKKNICGPFCEVSPNYSVSVGNLAKLFYDFKDSRNSLITEKVGNGLVRIMHATYMSYLPTSDFAYSLNKHEDERGNFVEFLKTQDSGQFSYFTAHPGITRGGHYHHTKTEKFLVVKGEAEFNFRNILTNESCKIQTTSKDHQVIETIPGWAHDITNIGDSEMIVLLWANEIFDQKKPDTYNSPL